jgi:hypothetical protein
VPAGDERLGRILTASPALFFAMLLVLLFAPGLRGQTVITPPAWWAERDALAGLPADDSAVVTRQQLYQFALAALLELDGKLAGAGGASGTLSAAAALLGTPQPLLGLHAEYFNNPDFSGSPALVRQETTVGFDGGEGGSPASPAPGVDARGFSARWAGELIPATGGLRVFELWPTNGTASLWVNGLPIPPAARFALPLLANQPVSILLEYTAPASADDAAGLAARWGFGPDPATGQDNFRLTESRATIAGWQSVGTRELFGLNIPNPEWGESVEGFLTLGQTLLTGGPIGVLADADYYNYSGWFHTWGLSGDSVLAYGSNYGAAGWGGLAGGTVGPWELVGTPAGVLALTPPASIGGGTVSLTYITDIADGWLYLGLFSAADFATWNELTPFGQTNALGEFRSYENLSLLNGTVGRLREFALALRDRLIELGYRDLPALPTGSDSTVLTVGDLKALFSFDLDRDTDGDGRSFAQEIAAGTDPNDWYNGRAPQIAAIAGDGQSGPPGYYLGEPLAVRVLDDEGLPLAHAPVDFFVPAESALRLTGMDTVGLPAGEPLVAITLRADGNGLVIVPFVSLEPGAADGEHRVQFFARRGTPPTPAQIGDAVTHCDQTLPVPAVPIGNPAAAPAPAPRYLVVPLSAFGWPEGAEASELDDHGGVLGKLPSFWGSGGTAIYWRPGMAAPAPVPVLDFSAGRDDAYLAALWQSRGAGGGTSWDDFALLAGHGPSNGWTWPALSSQNFRVRRLSSDGRVAGWASAGQGADAEGAPLMLGTVPAVWRHGAATVTYSPGQGSAGLALTDDANWTMGLTTAGALTVNKHGVIAGWETSAFAAKSLSSTEEEVTDPETSSSHTVVTTQYSTTYTMSAYGWLRSPGAETAVTVSGTLALSKWFNSTSNSEDPEGTEVSGRNGQTGTVFLPQMLGDSGVLAGLTATVSTSPESVANPYSSADYHATPTLTVRPAVRIGTESVSRTISLSGLRPETATISGVTHGTVTEAVVYGTALTHAGRPVAWQARASNNWKTEPIQAGLSAEQSASLNTATSLDMNVHGSMVFNDDSLVEAGQLYFFGDLIATPGINAFAGKRINSYGTILGSVTTATGSQPALALRVSRTTVTFSGVHYHQLRSDDGSVTYSAPQYDHGVAVASRDWPVAYTRNTKPTVAAEFRVPELAKFAASGQPVVVRASWLGGEQFTCSATITATGALLVPSTEAVNPLPNTVGFHPSLEIDWALKIGTSAWVTFARTEHTVYITWADPISTAASLMRETLFNIGSRTADGKAGTAGPGADEKAVVEAIYEQFTKRDIRRVVPGTANLRGEKLTYWKSDSPNVDSTAGLLSSPAGDGTCGAWAHFYIDVLRAQGIDATFVKITPRQEVLDQVTTYIHQIHGAAATISSFESIVQIKQPLPAQGVSQPSKSVFLDHAIVRYGASIDGPFYDPSYGTSSSQILTRIDWENRSLIGEGAKGIGTDASQQPFSQIVVYPNQPTLRDCSFTDINY